MQEIRVTTTFNEQGEGIVVLEHVNPNNTNLQDQTNTHEIVQIIINDSNQQDESSLIDKRYDGKTWKNQKNIQRYNNRRMNMGNKRK